MNKRILWVLITLLAAFPLVRLFYKSSQAPPLADVQLVKTPITLSSLEDSVRVNPSFDNLVALGNAYINEKTPGKSVSLFQQALKIQPRSAVAWNDLGVAYTMLQQYGKGVEACQAALLIDPGFTLARNNLAWALDEVKKVKEKIAEMEKIPESNRTIDAEMQRGLLYLTLSDYDSAIRIWSAISEKQPANMDALNNLGTAFVLKGQYDDAIAILNKVITVDPANQLAKNNLAWAQEEKEHAKKGELQ